MTSSPRSPSGTLIVDTNILLSGALGEWSRPSLDVAAGKRRLVTSLRARDELLGVAAGLQHRFTQALDSVLDVLGTVSIAEESDYAARLEEAAETLRLAPASRNGSPRDAHILALAWALDADIWSHDRDFAGTGWPSWSSANLRGALADA